MAIQRHVRRENHPGDIDAKKIAPLALAAVMITILAWGKPAQTQMKFEPYETTIAEIHQAIRSGRITCRQLVEAYLKRINAYDQPTKLNSIVVVNPQALAEADKLDAEFKRTEKLRRLHGIPVIVKDNYDTKDLQTTGGSLALKGSIPPDDAFQVRRIREAGAIVLAKSNMAEWAFSPMLTESSIAGVTRNPYDLERVPAGSSGGTAAAVAASFGAVGLGHRHRQFDQRPVFAQRAGRHSLDDGVDQPRRHHPALSAQ